MQAKSVYGLRPPSPGAQPREPLRTLVELGHELNVTPQLLGKLFKKYDGPEVVFAYNNVRFRGRSTYYRPKEVHAWWAALPDDVKKKAKGEAQ